MKRLIFASLLSLLIALPAAAQETSLTIGSTQSPATLHPHYTSQLAKSYLLGFVRRPFTAYDEHWEAVCRLCVEVPSLEMGTAEIVDLEGGGQGIWTEWEIREGMSWGDGEPVTADDVVLGWEIGKHPDSAVDTADLYRRILQIEVIDERRFRMLLDRVHYKYDTGAPEPLPAHLERAIFEEDPATYQERTLYDTDPTNPGLWFGPYVLSDLEKGASYSFALNPYWPDKAPYFDQITVRVIENTAALQANLLSGALDMISGELGMSVDQALDFERRHGDDYQIIYKPGLIYEHLEPALSNPALADVRVRQALLMAIDRPGISESLYGGKQPVADGNVNPQDWVALDNPKRYPYDPEKAAAVLEEAGWMLGPDGVRQNASGEKLAIELMTTAGARNRELVQQVIQQNWAEVGVEATIRNEPARVFFGETVRRRLFTGMAMFAWISAPESAPFTTLHSSQIPTEENGWSGQNAAGYSNPRVDELIDAIEVELDPEARKVLWTELQQIYIEELPALPLYWRAAAYVLPQTLKGVRPTGNLDSTSLWVEDWYLED